MSIHISARRGEIAPIVLLPGDPLRARFVAEQFLSGAVCHNEVRGMLGYTGEWKGLRVSVQGTGMGMPSISIYSHELIHDYGCKTLIRIGSCGSMQETVPVRSLVLAQAACTDSAMNKHRFGGMDYAPVADFGLLAQAAEAASAAGKRFAVGNVLSSDVFYDDKPDAWRLWAGYGVLAVEMEAAALYTEAAAAGVRALTILQVSDSLLTREAISSAERQTGFADMIELALETAARASR